MILFISALLLVMAFSDRIYRSYGTPGLAFLIGSSSSSRQDSPSSIIHGSIPFW